MKIETEVYTIGESFDGGVNFTEGKPLKVIVQNEGRTVIATVDDKYSFEMSDLEKIVSHMRYVESVD